MAKKKDTVPETDYEIFCITDFTAYEFKVPSLAEEILPAAGMYVHVDIRTPWPEDSNDLRVEVLVAKSERNGVTAWFDKDTIRFFREGDRLHIHPVLLTDLMGDDYMLGKDETDELVIRLHCNDQLYKEQRITVRGPWAAAEAPASDEPDPEETIARLKAELDRLPGWQNFKRRLDEIVSHSRLNGKRKEAGLDPIAPKLHTLIIGRPGTGKTSCIPYLTAVLKALGYLTTDAMWTTRVSMLSSSNVNGEVERTNDAIEKAQGGTLIFENAHELFRTEVKNYDTEQRIVRTLVDAMDDTEKYPRWMLVLTGEPEGMESLLAAYPDLKQHFQAPVYMEDFLPEELFRMIDPACENRDLTLSEAARRKLEMYILHKYNHRSKDFLNGWLVDRLFEEQIVPAMFRRLADVPEPTPEQLETVEAQDIPAVNTMPDTGLDELDALIGLGKIKTRVRDYLHAVRLAGRRMEQGLPTNMPRLHMAFLGNPGTGKTTVAEIIGKVFASWGILSGGRVIRTEKSQMVGQYIGETEFKMRNLLARAQGNILFIDEAYQLVEGGEKDYGRIVMNSLLTELGKENQNMVVILAGYTAPMKQLLESNEGIESRFPNVFNFEDYTTDELVDIGKLMIRRQGFTLTPGAEANLRAIIEEESEKPSPRFGNGRFVSNLLQNEILATLGERTARIEHPTREDLSTILPEDVVIGKAQKDVVFDDVAIDAALARLDALAGLDGVKKAIHNFVQSARYLHSIGEPYVGKGLLGWRFIGKTGTGKSTVAEIMAQILKGMRLIANSHITEIKGERIIQVSEADQDKTIREAVKKSCNGLIFIDADTPALMNDPFLNYARTIEQIRLRVKELTIEAGGECAIILAELEAPNQTMAEQLSESGVYEFDHTLVFKDFTPDELYEILCSHLAKFDFSFTPAAEKHMRDYLARLSGAVGASARTMKLMARTIYQQVILRESGLSRRPKAHQVQLTDVETFRWDAKKGKIGF